MYAGRVWACGVWAVLFIVEQTACNLFEKQQWWAAEQSLEAQITVHYYCYIAELATQFHT